jgi:hypothetical protein
MRRPALLLGLAALTLVTCGCHYEGGPLYSADRFTYVSREWQPWTVSLIDTRTGESLWSVDVPVGQKLVVGFRAGSGPNEYKPDMMDWGLMPEDRTYGERPNQLPVPPAGARRIEPTLRPAPELPGTPAAGSPFDTKSEVPPRFDEMSPAPTAPAPAAPVNDTDPGAPVPEEKPTEAPVEIPQGSRGG